MANQTGPSPYQDEQWNNSRNLSTTGRPPDTNGMDVKRVRPRWTGYETSQMMDSGIGYTQDLYRLAHAQLVGRKRHAEVDSESLLIADTPDSAGNMPWDVPHKRVLFG